jgi:hypothetical protein
VCACPALKQNSAQTQAGQKQTCVTRLTRRAPRIYTDQHTQVSFWVSLLDGRRSESRNLGLDAPGAHVRQELAR